ncbi:MAG: sulfatase-like hydrolase/transferase [Myxococcales bacterium]|nr:sulfatase-like hydrolase/transferase [Myxococcales bacterium]
MVASMLSGASPTEHGLVDGDARLVKGPTLVSEAARQAGIATAFFTANPTTSAAFGFDRGWEVFQAKARSATDERPQVFDGGHSLPRGPQDRPVLPHDPRPRRAPAVGRERRADEGPAARRTSTGLDPKHAGELLAKAKRVPPVIRYTDGDRERAAALHTLAVQAHDAALGRLLSALRLNGRDESTTVIVTGDVAADEGAHAPFAESDALDEGTLATFLVVRPHAALPLKAGRVTAPSESMHVASTVLDAFGLRAPRNCRWPSLFELAESATAPTRRPGRGRFALAVLGALRRFRAVGRGGARDPPLRPRARARVHHGRARDPPARDRDPAPAPLRRARHRQAGAPRGRPPRPARGGGAQGLGSVGPRRAPERTFSGTRPAMC